MAGGASALMRVAASKAGSLLEVVARRLEDDPQGVLPTLKLLADPDAVGQPVDPPARTGSARSTPSGCGRGCGISARTSTRPVRSANC